MTRLSVNINKVALLRNSRGGSLPDLVQVAKDCEAFGAQGITVHPRPDERHIRYSDIQQLKEIVTTEFNIEGYPSPAFMKLVLDNPPHQCTLVPDSPEQLTSDHGWDTNKEADFLKGIIAQLKAKNIRVSLFLDAEEQYLEGAKAVGADRIEFYTGDYAKNYAHDRAKVVAAHRQCAKLARELDLGINAGHDLNLENLKYYVQEVEGLLEVSIGHALIADALYLGLEKTIGLYLECLE
ncbi:MAG: pyridoxine 5'-phosphate synthase [Bacteroidota bacterium]